MKRPDEIALWFLVVNGERPRDAGARLGIHPKRVRGLCEKWASAGIYDYGVCADLGWVEPGADLFAGRRTDAPLIDPKLWEAAAARVDPDAVHEAAFGWLLHGTLPEPFEQADLSPHIEACDAAVRDLVYRYDPRPAPAQPFEEGVTTGYQVMWSGRPGPARLRPVAMLVDEDGHVVVEPTGEWQDTNVVDDRESRP